MRIAYASDLHLEFGCDLAALLPTAPEADALVLAGDLETDPIRLAWQLRRVRAQVATPIILVLGNHEFYGHDFPGMLARYRQALHDIPHVHLLEREVLTLAGVRFVGATLWTDFAGGRHTRACELEMTDFRVITDSVTGQPITAARIIRAHKESWEWLTCTLAEDVGGPTVVVTHHAPSFRSNPPRFAGSAIAGGFCSDKDEVLQALPCPPVAWIHGHLHDPADYAIGATRILCHPWGYDDERGPRDFGVLDVVKPVVRVSPGSAHA